MIGPDVLGRRFVLSPDRDEVFRLVAEIQQRLLGIAMRLDENMSDSREKSRANPIEVIAALEEVQLWILASIVPGEWPPA